MSENSSNQESTPVVPEPPDRLSGLLYWTTHINLSRLLGLVTLYLATIEFSYAAFIDEELKIGELSLTKMTLSKLILLGFILRSTSLIAQDTSNNPGQAGVIIAMHTAKYYGVGIPLVLALDSALEDGIIKVFNALPLKTFLDLIGHALAPLSKQISLIPYFGVAVLLAKPHREPPMDHHNDVENLRNQFRLILIETPLLLLTFLIQCIVSLVYILVYPPLLILLFFPHDKNLNLNERIITMREAWARSLPIKAVQWLVQAARRQRSRFGGIRFEF